MEHLMIAHLGLALWCKDGPEDECREEREALGSIVEDAEKVFVAGLVLLLRWREHLLDVLVKPRGLAFGVSVIEVHVGPSESNGVINHLEAGCNVRELEGSEPLVVIVLELVVHVQAEGCDGVGSSDTSKGG